MMYILVPLLLIFISISGIAVIVLRKKNHLEKIYSLNAAGGNSNLAGSFSWKEYGMEFFPELRTFINRLEVRRYKTHWLVETEKFLRKTRVIFLKFDRVSDVLIKRIRKINHNQRLNEAETVKTEIPVEEPILQTEEKIDDKSVLFLKNEENRLILEIAKNPKDGKLYEQLGDICTEMGNFADAKESYEAAVELNPQNDALKQKLSLAMEKLGPQN